MAEDRLEQLVHGAARERVTHGEFDAAAGLPERDEPPVPLEAVERPLDELEVHAPGCVFGIEG